MFNFDVKKPIKKTLEEYRIYIENELCFLQREQELIEHLTNCSEKKQQTDGGGNGK